MELMMVFKAGRALLLGVFALFFALAANHSQADEPGKCKFGMIGTPPGDCHCPDGTSFGGFKGCIPIECPSGAVLKGNGCVCPAGTEVDPGTKGCRPKPQPQPCPAGMIGTQPNCSCSSAMVPNGGGGCKCAPGAVQKDGGGCKYPNKCGSKEVRAENGKCECAPGTIRFASRCAKGRKIVCVWRGTAPACDGSCFPGEEFFGSGSSSFDNAAPPEYRAGFGSKCWSGNKALCCHVK